MEIHVSEVAAGQVKPGWLAERAHIDIIVPPEARIQTPITILHLHGVLDGETYRLLIEKVQSFVDQEGVRRMIFDLAGVESLSNAGLCGVYLAGLLVERRSTEGLEGYLITKQMSLDLEMNVRFFSLHLAAAPEKILRALSSIGFTEIAPYYETVNDAISAFP